MKNKMIFFMDKNVFHVYPKQVIFWKSGKCYKNEFLYGRFWNAVFALKQKLQKVMLYAFVNESNLFPQMRHFREKSKSTYSYFFWRKWSIFEGFRNSQKITIIYYIERIIYFGILWLYLTWFDLGVSETFKMLHFRRKSKMWSLLFKVFLRKWSIL